MSETTSSTYETTMAKGLLSKSPIIIIQTDDFMAAKDFAGRIPSQRLSKVKLDQEQERPLLKHYMAVTSDSVATQVPAGTDAYPTAYKDLMKGEELENPLRFLRGLVDSNPNRNLLNKYKIVANPQQEQLYIFWPAADTLLKNPVVPPLLHELSERLRVYPYVKLYITVHPSTALEGYLNAFPMLKMRPTSAQNKKEWSSLYSDTNKNNEAVQNLMKYYTYEQWDALLDRIIHETEMIHRYTRRPAVFNNLIKFAKDLSGIDINSATVDQDKRDHEALLFAAIRRKQAEEINKRAGLSLINNPTKMKEVGGYEVLKEWLAMRQQCFTPEAKAYGVEAFKGVMLVGPSGTGKTYITSALANDLGLPLINMNMGAMLGSLVGSSEANVKQALDTLKAVAPCVVLIDEVDKVFGTSSGTNDGGVMTRVLGDLLSFMNDQEGVVMVFTANRVHNLPAELVRSGRMDAIFGIDLPTKTERANIIDVHLKKRKFTMSEAVLGNVIDMTEGYSGAELAAIVKEAVLREYNGARKSQLAEESVLAAVKSVNPQSKVYADQTRFMQDWIAQHGQQASKPDSTRQLVTTSGETLPESDVNPDMLLD